MRIISDFRDYYDGVQGQGFDDKVIYQRRSEDSDIRAGMHVGGSGPRWTREPGDGDTRQPQEDQALLPPFHHYRPELFGGHGRWARYESRCENGMLYLAGRAYPFWKMQDNADGPGPLSFDEKFEGLVRQVDESPRWRPQQIDLMPWKAWLADHWGREIDPAVHFLHRSPLILYLGDRRTVNPCLRDHGFQKVLDPYTVFQELEMFLGGVMAERLDPPSPQSDKEKIASHGMDVKRSFRKMPRL